MDEVTCLVCGYRLRLAGLRIRNLEGRPDDHPVLTVTAECPECRTSIPVGQLIGDDFHYALGVVAHALLRSAA